eukprot:756768-Hanusia_phi.AAC.3
MPKGRQWKEEVVGEGEEREVKREEREEEVKKKEEEERSRQRTGRLKGRELLLRRDMGFGMELTAREGRGKGWKQQCCIELKMKVG